MSNYAPVLINQYRAVISVVPSHIDRRMKVVSVLVFSAAIDLSHGSKLVFPMAKDRLLDRGALGRWKRESGFESSHAIGIDLNREEPIAGRGDNVKPMIGSFFRLGLLAMMIALTGCAYGTVSRIYATSGSDISLTEVRAANEPTAICVYQEEAYLLIEKAAQAAVIVEGAVRKGTGLDAREDEPPPPCVAFKIHERLWFEGENSETINVQEHLREEFGSGHAFRNVSIHLKIDGLDWALNIMTLGFANSRTLEITGDLHPRTR
jgi:hypothetical protein